MELTPEETRDRLGDYLTEVAGCAVEVGGIDRLSGGAIQENWAVQVTVADGEWAGIHQLVLRKDAASGVTTSHGRAREFMLLKAAHRAGVNVPEPCFLCEDTDILGAPFFLMHHVAGEAAGHRLVKHAENSDLAHELGRQLARIHAIVPPREDLAFLGPPPGNPAGAAIERYRSDLDALEAPMPVLEWGLAWLARNRPDPSAAAAVLCHRDYRTGNYMVADGALSGILDWEFAGWGDRHEDIAWFCAKCWRFGADGREAGGIAERDPFYHGYGEESGRTIDAGRVAYWEVMAHVRWAVIAVQQAARHLSGAEPSLELALTGHIVPELELEVLNLTGEQGHG